ncbi:MAG: DNA-binding response regulator [Bacteroidetes bacterium]|nr:DNA-binding response regulator [Bacteroidota bacterium]
MDEQTTVLIADDHPVVRSGLRAVLEQQTGLHVIGEAGNGETALQLIRQHSPRLAILDVEMPGMDGFRVAQHILDNNLPVDVIFMNKAMEAGAKGFVLKENAVVDILSCVTAVLQGKHYVSPALTDHLLRRKTKQPLTPSSTLDVLTPTERKILTLIAEQKTSKTIADELFISYKTVEKHRSNICSKLGLRGAYALLKFALENKHNL